jgi:hypothetical protein
MKNQLNPIFCLFIFAVLFSSCSSNKSNVDEQFSDNSSSEGFFGGLFSDNDICFVTVSDPKENAFKVNLPKGWNSEVSLVRRGTQYRNAGVSNSPDGKTSLFFGDPSLPYFSLPISEYGMREGMQTGDPLLQVSRFISPDKFFSNYVKKKHSNKPGFRITNVQPNNNIKQSWESEIQKAGVQAQISTADISFEFVNGNEKIAGKVQGVCFLLQQGWGVSLNGYTTQASNIDVAEKCLAEMTSSFKSNEEWMTRENKMAAQRMNAQHQQNMQASQASFNAHQQRMAANQASFNAHQNKMKGIYAASDAQFNNYMSQQQTNDQSHQNYMNQQYSNDRSHENFVDYIRDEQRVSNGNQYGKVESGYNNYYVNESTGEYFGTQSEMDVVPDNYEQWQPEY